MILQWAQQSIKNILEDVSNFNLAYTTHNDICSVFPGETLLAIRVIIVITCHFPFIHGSPYHRLPMAPTSRSPDQS